MKAYSIYVWLMIIIICSFIGWIIENLWIMLRFGCFDNRNMFLPFLLGYGMAVFLISTTLGTSENYPDFIYGIKVFIFVSIAELLLGYSFEFMCGFRYWDYSALPLHFTCYTSLFTSMGFSMLITGFMRLCFKPLVSLLCRYESAIKYISVLGIVILAFDFLLSFHSMRIHRSYNKRWEIYLKKSNKSENAVLKHIEALHNMF